MAEKQGIALASIAGFPEAVANQLAGLWVTTAEELVSAARQEGGPQGLAEYLGLAEDEVGDLVDLAVAALPAGVDFAPDDVLAVGLGALDEPEGEAPDGEPVSFAPLPNQTDLRNHMPPVRNQGRRGTCVAHACVAVREYLLGEASTGGDLSEQFLYWRCKETDGYPDLEGTWIRVGMERLKEDGVCVERIWPYNPNPVSGNQGQGPPPSGAEQAAHEYKITGATPLQARWVSALRQSLADEAVVAFSVPVYTYWLVEPTRSSGDIRMPLSTDPLEGGHAMCLVGYEDDPDVPGGGFFYLRNSWGERWGRDNVLGAGYGRIPYSYLAEHGRSAYTASAPVEEEKTAWERFIEWLRALFGG